MIANTGEQLSLVVTKKDLILQAIEACGPKFCQRAVANWLAERGVRVSPVYIYSVKREKDGMAPYDQRHFIFTRDKKAKTKTQIATELLVENPGLTSEALHKRLTDMGIVVNLRHIRRLVGIHRKKSTGGAHAVISLAEQVGGLGALREMINNIETQRMVRAA